MVIIGFLGAVALASAATIKTGEENLPVVEESTVQNVPVEENAPAGHIHHSHDEHEHFHHREYHSMHHSHTHSHPDHSHSSHEEGHFHEESKDFDHSYQHTHDVTTYGEHDENDKLAYSSFIFKQPAANETVEIIKTYNVDFVNYTRRTITHLDVYNRLANDFSSTADLVSGGPGSGHATFIFRSQIGKPIGYKIEVHAKDNETAE